MRRKVDFAKAQENALSARKSAHSNLRDKRATQRAKDQALDREVKKRPVEYGLDGEMLTHPGIPMKEIHELGKAGQQRKDAAKRFQRARAIQRNIGILEGVSIGQKVEFESVRGHLHKGKVTAVDVTKGIVYLKKGFFSEPAALNILALKRRVK